MVLCIQVGQAGVIIDTSIVYPKAVFSNEQPSAGEKLAVQWILGMNEDACVPTYETKVLKTINQGVISYQLTYKKLAQPQDFTVCAKAITPFGPTFAIGPFESGYTYRIYIDTVLIREFSIAKKTFPYAKITPGAPRDGDSVSVQWVLGEDTVNCVMQYASELRSISLLKSNPPIHAVAVSFREMPVEYLACLSRPTLYGPIFNIGKVEAGDYVVTCNTETVAKFTVAEKGEVKPVINISPLQPFEGDTMNLKVVLGNGSSSCAPKFTTKFERTMRETDVYEYKLSYETIPNTNTVCTKDCVPFGPEWIFNDLKSGTHVFWYTKNDYYKVFVQKKRQIPDFPYVTIKGTVYDMRKAVDTTGNDIRAAIVPGCTVMVVVGDVVAAKKTSYLDSINTAEGVPSLQPQIIFKAVTSQTGEYSISNVPSAALLNKSYTIGIKNGFIGYGYLPDVLTENITSNITLYKMEEFVDSVRTFLGGSDEVVSLLKQLGIKDVSRVVKSTPLRNKKAFVLNVAGGFELINPSQQMVSISAYALNGKRIWNKDATLLPEGKQFIAIPRIVSGVFLLSIHGEQFEHSEVFTLKNK
jgi:hypothetical protein